MFKKGTRYENVDQSNNKVVAGDSRVVAVAMHQLCC